MRFLNRLAMDEDHMDMFPTSPAIFTFGLSPWFPSVPRVRENQQKSRSFAMKYGASCTSSGTNKFCDLSSPMGLSEIR